MTYGQKFMWFALGLLSGVILMWAVPARAQDGWLPTSRCEWRHGKERCARRHRTGAVEYHWTSRQREPTRERVYSYEHRSRCLNDVHATGEERYGSDRAKEAATATWMERVRFLHGTRYMDPKNSRHLSFECGRSSTGNRASEKTAEVTGRYLEQCEVRAQPCRAESEGGKE